ncbi:MAG: phage tail protein [Gammaproteobacteria bacterium]
MSLNINFHTDIKAVERYLGRLQRDKIVKAASRALNKTITSTRTQAVRFIAKDIGIKQKLVRDNISLYRANRRTLQASLTARRNRFKLIDIDPKAKQNTVGINFKGQGKRRVIPHAFIIRRTSGNKRAIVKRKGKSRYPIFELKGPSVATVFRKNPAMTLMEKTAQVAWVKNFTRELNYELRK